MGGHVQVSLHKLISKPLKHRCVVCTMLAVTVILVTFVHESFTRLPAEVQAISATRGHS